MGPFVSCETIGGCSSRNLFILIGSFRWAFGWKKGWKGRVRGGGEEEGDIGREGLERVIEMEGREERGGKRGCMREKWRNMAMGHKDEEA